MATLLKADGTTSEVTVNGLGDMQKAIGGWIEVIPGLKDENGRLAICNEEGIMYDLPLNMEIWTIHGLEVFGDVLFVDETEFN